MKIVHSRWLPPRGYSGINLFGVLFVHPGQYVSPRMLNHERIHTAQMREMAFIPFYLFYIMEWMVKKLFHRNAYRNISFEREAYDNDHNLNYLSRRPLFAWRHYLRKK